MREKLLLRVIGLGIKIPDHITIECQRALSSCKRIFTVVQEPPNVWLPSESRGKIPVTGLLEMYVEGALRTENYDRVADAILQSVRDDQTTGYATYGNPLAYDSVAQTLVRRAQHAGIAFDVVPGISSIDTLLCDMGFDMAPGIQVYETSWLVAARIRLQTNVAAILLQVGAFGSFRMRYYTRPQAESLKGLVAHLTESYPSAHQVFLVRSSGVVGGKARIRGIPLGSLCDATTEDLLNCSLYIPPSRFSELDPQVIARMTS